MTRRTTTMLAVLAAAATAVAGCGGSAEKKETGATAAGSDILRVPYLADMSVPDPDVFYDIEGNAVILNQYEGLLKYKVGTSEIVGSLAKSFEVSDDGLVYTFVLQDGVTFHSGPAMTCESVKASFQRRLDVDQAPAYMLKPVKSMDCTDDATLVITLKEKVNPFLAYLASSWGPKVIGPEAIETNAAKDFGQKWLSTHGDGTGPFKLTLFKRGRTYELTRNDAYWGTKANFRKVLISITPDMSTQRLKLESGDEDAILHSFPASELESLPDDIKVVKEESLLRLLLYVNPNKAPFNDPAVRAGLASTVDVDQLVAEGYSDTATKSEGAYPSALLPDQPPLPYAVDAAKAKAAADKAATKKITLAYSADESGVQRRVGELLQAQLKAVGYDVSIKEVQLPQIYGYISDLKKAPDLLLQTNTPDAADPDTWARIVFYSTGGLNFLGYENKKVDAALDKALGAPEAEATQLYKDAGQMVIDDNAVMFLGDVKNVFVFRDTLTNVEQVPAYPWTIDFATVKRAG